MKVCSICHTGYSADDDFCPLDGSPMVLKDQGGRVVVSWDTKPADEVPTQYVSVPRPGPAAPDNSKWLYALLGGLAAIVVMGGAYFFITGQREQRIPESTVQGSPSPGNSSVTNTSGENRNQGTGSPAINTNTPFDITNKAQGPAMNTNRGAPLERKFRRTYFGTLDAG